MRVHRIAVLVVAVACVVALGAWASVGHHHGGKELNAAELDALLGRFERFEIRKPNGKIVEIRATKTGVRPVLLLHELPGMTPETLDLALRLEQNGFRVYMPLLFGEAGKRLSNPRIAVTALRRDINPVARDAVSPMIAVARLTLDAIEKRHPGRSIGVIGMCLTGNFGISLLADPRVGAAVLSQPALPFGISASHKRSLGVSDADIEAARRSDKPMLALRFVTDDKSPAERFETLRKEFPRLTIHPPLPTGVRGIPKNAHAVLTEWFRPEPDHPTHLAFLEVVRFLQAVP